MGYHPCSIGFLTSRRDPAVGQCQTGSLTGAVASEGYRRRPKVPQDGRKPSKECKGRRSLTATPTGGAGTKVGLSDPVVLRECHRSTDKSYLGITGLSLPRVHIDGVVWHLDVGSSHPGAVVGPKGLGCSPIKAVRELGSERRETVRSLSGVGVGYLRELSLSTRGPGWTGRWCTS